MVLCLGQARAIRETAHAWPPVAVDQDCSLLRLCEVLRDSATGMADLAARIMEAAWTTLFAKQMDNPQGQGEQLDGLLRAVADSFTKLEALLKRRQAAGLAVPGLAPLAQARAILDRLDKRFREGWPYLPPEELAEIEQARHRPRSEYLTLEELARGLATPHQP